MSVMAALAKALDVARTTPLPPERVPIEPGEIPRKDSEWRNTSKGKNRGRIAVVTSGTAPDGSRVEYRYKAPLTGLDREGDRVAPYVQTVNIPLASFRARFEPVTEAT